MVADENFFKQYFDESRSYKRLMLERLGEEPEEVLDQACFVFTQMGSELAYAGEREHPMANSVLSCAALLAIYLVVEDKGIDAHRFGAAMLENMRQAIEQARERASRSGRKPDPEKARQIVDRLIEAGQASQSAVQPGEFVFSAQREDDGNDWRMEISSCAICALFSKYDAMDLVPYMCATDDLMSDLGNEGLTRTGTIALGRSHCDFHYRPGHDGRHLSELYPDRIRTIDLQEQD